MQSKATCLDPLAWRPAARLRKSRNPSYVLFTLFTVVWSFPASAHLLPRVDLPEGLALGVRQAYVPDGIQGITLGLDYTVGPLSFGTDCTVLRATVLDPMVRFAARILTTPNCSIGLSGSASYEHAQTRWPEQFVHGYALDLGLCTSIGQTFAIGSNHSVRLYFDSVLSFATLDDRSFDTGMSTGYEAGLAFDNRIEVMFANIPRLTGHRLEIPVLGVIGMRARY